MVEIVREPLRLPRRMVPTDALFWYAEAALPSFRATIAGIYDLDRPPDRDRARAAVEASLARVPRLGQRVVEAPLHLGLPEWVEDPHFDLEYHMRWLSLPAPGTHRQLLDTCAQLFATPLDHERPLWEAYVIEGRQGGRAAFFFKMHHSVVDGVGALALLDVMTQKSRDAKVARVAAGRRRARAPGLAERMASLVLDQARTSVRLGWSAATAPARAARHPVEFAAAAIRTARGLRAAIADVTRPSVDDPLARGSSGLSRRLDTMSIPLDRLSAARSRLGVTLNDLVLATLAGTLGAYHRERHVRVSTLNCLVPMNLRSSEEQAALGNRIGLFNIELPVADRGPRRRLERIVEQTAAAKRDRRAHTYPFLAQLLPLVPTPAFRFIARRSLGRVNLACTNIPGLPEQRYLAGGRIDAIYPFASVVEKTPLVMGLFSYAGSMDIGIDTDPEAIPDPHRLAELFESELQKMEALSPKRRRPRRRG